MVQPLSVDSSVTVFYSCLVHGGCLHVIPEDVASDPAAMEAYFETHHVDCLKIAPSHLAALQGGLRPECLLPRRVLIVGGEESRGEWLSGVQTSAPNCEIFNHYGPTETTVGVLMHRFVAAESEVHCTVPIGTPLANTQVYVLDAQLRPVPSGVNGELYISGLGLARGYLNMPRLTAERFVANPYDTLGRRMYRTGDLVRWSADGSLEFLGRTDTQVKIRGFRIELGEIEAAFRSEAHVHDVAVIAHQNESGEKRLISYVVAGERSSVDSEVIKKQVAGILPEYMVPTAIVMMKALPLTPHGKLDRKALPIPEFSSARKYKPPQTPEEKILCELIQEILGVKPVGNNDNFFELGGHSLLATRLVNRVRTSFGLELQLRDIFLAETIADLSVTLTLLNQARSGLQSDRNLNEILEDTYL